jgi:hypothetical protein
MPHILLPDITKRCQNCGGLKKEHRIRKPYRCPTRLTESYWKPWTIEAFEEAVKAGEAVVTPDAVKVTVVSGKELEGPALIAALRRLIKIGDEVEKEEASEKEKRDKEAK